MKKQFKIQAIPFDKEKIEAGDIVFIESHSAYGIVESYNKYAEIAFPYDVTSSADAKHFKADELKPIKLVVVSTDTPVMSNYIIGKCNNIPSMPVEIMKVTAVMPHSKSICCEGIWTDGSEQKIIAAFPEYNYVEGSNHNLPTLSHEFIADWCLNPVEVVDVDVVPETSEFFEYVKVVNNAIIASLPAKRLEFEANEYAYALDTDQGTEWSENMETLAAKMADFAKSEVVKAYWFEKFNEECTKSITLV